MVFGVPHCHMKEVPMRIASFVLCIALTPLLACSPVDVDSGPLVGTWSTGRMPHSPTGSWEVRLSFTPDGRFTQRITNYGVYPDTPAGQRSSEINISGTYATSDDRLDFTATSHVWWDAFYADPGPHTGEPPANMYVDCTFELGPSRLLTLTYTTYPADAPVETVRTLHRQ
jgi:hypothetical protein